MARQAEAWMSVPRRMVIRSIVIAVGLILALLLFFGFYFENSDEGSVREAAKLRAMVGSIPVPEAGEGTDREYASKRFEKGDWVLGIGRDSHALLFKYRGGTVVVKDSRDQIRCFFGHVCGPGGLKVYMQRSRSLDEFYKLLVEHNVFAEHQLP